MKSENFIDELLKRPIGEVSENFTDELVLKISNMKNIEKEDSFKAQDFDFDSFADYALAKISDVKLSDTFTEDTLEKVLSSGFKQKTPRIEIFRQTLFSSCAAIAAAAALWVGALALPDSLNTYDGNDIASYATMSEFSDEISLLQALILQEEYLWAYNL